jgi:hypothetical protein
MITNKRLRRFVDRRVKYWCDFYRAHCDAGVKGMKKGQHVMARDPEYVQELKGGGGGARPAQQKQLQRPSALKRAAVIGGSLAGVAGLGLLGAKFGRKLGGRMAGKAVATAKQTAPSVARAAKTFPISKPGGNKFSGFGGLSSTSQVKKNLNNPNHVWDI